MRRTLRSLAVVSLAVAALFVLSLPLHAQVTSSGTLTATPNPASVQQNVLLSTQFTAAAPPVGSPGAVTGTVTFKNGTATLGTGKLVLDAGATLPQVASSPAAALPSSHVSTVDLNKDGKPDALFFDDQGQLHVMLGTTPVGSFQADLVTLPDPSCGFINNFVMGDVNHDGFPDVVFNCQAGEGFLDDLLIGKGDGTFNAAVSLSGVYGGQIALGDMDKDGNLDLVSGGSISPPGCSTCNSGFMIFKGDGAGGFTLSLTTQTSALPGSEIAVADVDGDGYLDIVELNNTSQDTNSIDVYRNAAGTQFGTPSNGVYVPNASAALADFPSYFYGLYTGDFNGDGLPDFGVNGEQPALVTALNTSTSTTISFAAAKTIVLSSTPSSISVGDFNGDGNSDLLLVYNSSGATVYDSDGAGNFATNYAGLTIANNSIAAAVAVDLNADGDADVLMLAPVTLFDAVSYLTTGPANAKLTTSFAQSGVASLSAVWAGNGNIQGSTASTSLTVNSLPTSTSLNTSGTPTEYGQTVTLTASVSPGAAGGTPTGSITFKDGASVLGIVTMSGGAAMFSTTTLDAASHSLTAVYSGDTAFATSTSVSVSQVVAQAQSSVAWAPSPSTIVYGTQLKAAQLNATASSKYVSSVPGTFDYTPGTGAVLSAGSHTLSVIFTPANTTNFKSTTGTVDIIVSQATPAITWPSPSPIVYGTALSVTQLNATATGISGSLPGSFVYTPAAGTVLGAGNNQTLSVVFTPTDTTNYKSMGGSTRITVTRAQPVVNWSVPSPIVYGTALSATQLNATATGISGALPGVFDYSPSAGTVLGAGNNQALSVTFIPTDTTNYTTAGGGTTINVTKATPVVNWSAPSPIVYGTALSATQLNASATGIAGSLPGAFVYTPAAGTVLATGNNQALSVTFTPTDTADYTAATGGTTVNVTKATPAITWGSPSPIVYGTALSVTQLNATATGISGSLPGAFVYTPAAGVVLGAGTQQALNVTFTPTDTTNYVATTGGTTINVTRAVPTVNWSAPSPIAYGTALSATQLNATATGIAGSLPGTFVYTPAAGTVLAAGNNQALSVTFTPTDATNYATATGGTTLTVSKARPAVNWSAPAAIVYGTALSGTQLNAAATGIAGSLPGTFVYTPAAGTVLGSGTQQALSVAFTPTDTANYLTATGATTIDVGKAKPTVNWTAPAPIVIGTPLSSTQLNATATGISGSIPGTFDYTPSAGTQLSVGNNQNLGVTFLPADSTNYTSATGSTTIDVVALAISTLSPNTSSLGDPAKTVTVTGVGFFSDSVVRVNGVGVTTTYRNAASLTAVIPASYFTAVQTLSITVFDPTQGQTSNAVSLPVVASSPVVVFTGPGATQPATQPNLTFTLTNPYPAALTGTLTLTFAGTGGVNDPAVQFAAGGRTMTFTIAANSTVSPVIQFQSGTVAGTITVTLGLTAAGQNVTPGNVQPVVITIPPAAPALTSAALTRSGNVLTVTVQGFSNTREVSQAVFHFTAANGSSIADPDITLPATALFATWFSDVASQAYGSTFTYVQTFNLSSDAATVGSVTVQLTNSAGTSTTTSAQ